MNKKLVHADTGYLVVCNKFLIKICLRSIVVVRKHTSFFLCKKYITLFDFKIIIITVLYF